MNLKQIAQKRDELERRVADPKYHATERDMVEAAELVSQYIDELERLEESATVKPYLTADTVADEISKRWYSND